jgi:hypothetical protein
LVGARLIGPERAPALQHQNDFFVGRGHALPLPHVYGPNVNTP